MMELTEEQLAESIVPIPYTPVKRLSRDDILYVTEEDIPHPIEGYAKSHKEYGVIDLRGYRKGYEPRLEIRGIYTPNPEDTFRLQTGKLPPYQPTATGDSLLAEMRRLGVHKAFRIGKPEVEPEEMPAVGLSGLGRIEEGLAVARLQGAISNLVEGGFEIAPLRQNYVDDLVKLGASQRWAEATVDRVILEIKPPAVSAVEYDRCYTLEELREMAKRKGLSTSGSKKEIARRLIKAG